MEIKLYNWLAYFGAMPFVACALLILVGFRDVNLIGDLVSVVNSYGLVIVVFMSGIHWGNYFSEKQINTINLLVTSNIIAILSWLAFLIFPATFTLLFYCVSFSILLLIDRKLLSNSVISKDYYEMRCVVTSIVVISLSLTFVKLISMT